MSDFTIRSESVDVEQIMKQIRQRILEKRGADYTEEQIRELASVRLEKFLDPNNLRSDLLEQFRKSRPAPTSEPPAITPPYTAEQTDIFATHRGSVRFLRKLFAPLLKMMFNANTLHQVLHTQAQFNVDLLKREARRKIEFDRSRAEWNSLYYEVLHNLVLETTRMGIEVQNLRMKLESLSSRLDFSERRVRALEGVVQYRPEVVHRAGDEERPSLAAGSIGSTGSSGSSGSTNSSSSTGAGSFEGFVPGSGQQGDGSGKRRRRRRRGRRSGQGAFGAQGAQGAQGPQGAQGAEGAQGAQGAGPDSGEAYEAGEDEGDEFENGEEMNAGGFDKPEAVNETSTPPETPKAPETPWTEVPQPPKSESDDDLQ
ncbi:MAG TPA: hypothetical protein VFZ31_17005 [Vicinamibacterales bacterium]